MNKWTPPVWQNRQVQLIYRITLTASQCYKLAAAQAAIEE